MELSGQVVGSGANRHLSIFMESLMASLSWTFENIYTKVSEFLGLGSSPTGTNLTKVKEIVYRGYLKFLFPVHPIKKSAYVWQCLKRQGTFNTKADEWVYPLPAAAFDILGDLVGDPTESMIPVVTNAAMEKIVALRSLDDSSSTPSVYAVRYGPFDPVVGQRKELLLYPTPNEVYTYQYWYTFLPDRPANTTDYFIGGPAESECILECCLAVAEQQEDERIDVHSRLAADKIAELIMHDQAKAPDSVGINVDRSAYHMSAFDFKQWRAPASAMSVYGVSVVD